MSATQAIVIIVAIVTVLALYIYGTYKELESLRDRCKKAATQLDLQRQRRDALVAAHTAPQPSEEITKLEQQIAFTHQLASDAVLKYNTYKHKRPTVLVANFFGHGLDASQV